MLFAFLAAVLVVVVVSWVGHRGSNDGGSTSHVTLKAPETHSDLPWVGEIQVAKRTSKSRQAAKSARRARRNNRSPKPSSRKAKHKRGSGRKRKHARPRGR